MTPTAIAVVALLGTTDQSGSDGLCGTPAIDLFEWVAQTGAGVLFLGGLIYGGFKHDRAGMLSTLERKSEHRRTGTMPMAAGSLFGIIIILGQQAAAAAGFNVAECAQLTLWF